MTQLVINDLDFCQNHLPEPETIEGSGSYFSVEFDVDFESLFDPAGEAAAGFGAAIGLAIGDGIVINIGAIAF